MGVLVKSLLLASAVVTCLTGCGSEDAPSNGSAGSGGTADSNAAAGTAGTGFEAGNAGQAGSDDMAGTAGEMAGMAGSGGAGGTGGTGGTGGARPAGQAFLPDVPWEYVGQGPSGGLEVTHSTLRETEASIEWLVVVKNTGPDPICLVSVPVEFQDSTGAVLTDTEVFVHSPMWVSFDSAVPCLGTGDVGIAKSTILDELDISKVAKVEHGFSGNINPDATKITGVSVTGVEIGDFSKTAKQVTGKLQNMSGKSWKSPKVWLYPLDGAGRPLSEGFDIELVPLPNNGSWDFSMYVDLPIDDYATLFEFDDP